MGFEDRRLGEKLWRSAVGLLLRIQGFAGRLLGFDLEDYYNQLMDSFALPRSRHGESVTPPGPRPSQRSCRCATAAKACNRIHLLRRGARVRGRGKGHELNRRPWRMALVGVVVLTPALFAANPSLRVVRAGVAYKWHEARQGLVLVPLREP
jgi:hypothetical protein